MNIYDINELNNDLSQIIKSSNFLSKTIDSFREFIKGESHKESFDLKDCINDFIVLIDSSIKTNHINMELNLEDDIKIYGSKNELQQCLLNIYNNAKDSIIEQDEKYILVKLYKKNEYVYIDILDNGGGVPFDLIDKIFEPYFTTKHKSIGTGLGLSMTYQIINKSFDGEIFVENLCFNLNGINNVGANFSIKLPIKLN